MPSLTRRQLVGTPLALTFLPQSIAAATANQQAAAPATIWPIPDWTAASPEEVSIDPALPELLDSAATAAPSVTAVMVTRNGRTAAEHVAPGWAMDDPIDIRSCTKSFVSALVGRARLEGLLPDLSVTVGELIPERIPADADPAVADIALWSLLTMTSGLQWDWQTDYPRLEASDDPVALTLSQPIIAPQGEVYAYNSGGSHLIGLMVAAAAGMPLEEYAQEALFAPLGITAHDWRRTPQGEVIGGYGLQISPPDMARLGYLYLRDGVWDDKPLIAAEYVGQSIIVQSAGDPTGGTPYGYQWWVTNTSGYDAFFALGYGGQYIYVVPALDLVIAVAVGAIDVPLYAPRPIIEETIIPLVY